MDWMPFRKSTKTQAARPQDQPERDGSVEPATTSAGPEAPSHALDVIGRRNELVRDRIGSLTSRLDDLKGLQDHFASIIEPLAGVLDELPRATSRVAELEASLNHERQLTASARREFAALEDRAAVLDKELGHARGVLARLENEQVEREAASDELKALLRDRTLAVENLDRRLFAETEKAGAAAAEIRTLRGEIKALDQSLVRTDHELALARERISLLEQENHRLEQLADDQAAKLNDLVPRHDDLSATAAADRERVRQLEAQLEAEILHREKADSQYEAALASIRAERGSLELRLDGTINRAAATERLLAQLRDQLREKDEATRIADRNIKQAVIDRAAQERRIEGLHVELARHADRLLDLEREKAEIAGRADMLTKALAAKDAGLEQGTARNLALTERIDQMTTRHEADRAELERENRRLLEELQKERSERLMALGALAIARDSRVALQKQHDALRRSSRGLNPRTEIEHDGDVSDVAPEPDSNVRSFTSPNRNS